MCTHIRVRMHIGRILFIRIRMNEADPDPEGKNIQKLKLITMKSCQNNIELLKIPIRTVCLVDPDI